MILPLDYYKNHDVIALSRDFLGKYLFTNIDGVTTGGMIIETEAYRAPEDKASHAFGNRRTKRNEVMYHEGGTGYVYQCYGIHYLFNVVTNEADIPHAILIRAIRPEFGVEEMLRRRNKIKVDKTLAGGPGTVAQALGINLKLNGVKLSGPAIWLEDRGMIIPVEDILASPRVGVDYAGEDALLPWRFRIIH
jgi:DNA-3-methyladenine glycosylase